MKKLQFCFMPDNIRSAALYLLKVDAKPIIGKSLPDTEDTLRQFAMARFKEEYKDKANRSIINDGTLHGSVLWSGLGCVFISASLSGQCIESDMDVSEFHSSLECVVVSFHIYADKNA